MGNILLLAPTLHKLRVGVRRVYQHLQALGLGQHQDKTFNGRIVKGFHFLGGHLSRAELSVAAGTLERFVNM